MKKILTIEDDISLQGLEVLKLQKSGYEVITASTGGEGMEKINEPNIDLILLDLVLPDFDGFQILQKVKSDDNTKDIPVLVFSNLSEESDVRKAVELGAADFMVKSNFTLDQLVDHIDKLLK